MSSVPNRTYGHQEVGQDTDLTGDAMPKSRIVGGLGRRYGRRAIELPIAIEGQMAEICRDLALEAKRMRQLQEQADELRTVIRQWVGESEPDPGREPANRAGRRRAAMCGS
jgi:hypothetical protein